MSQSVSKLQGNSSSKKWKSQTVNLSMTVYMTQESTDKARWIAKEQIDTKKITG